MKKATIIATVALLIAAGTYFAFAAEQSNTMGEGMMGGGMMGQKGMIGQQGMMGQQGMAGQGMMGRGMMSGSSLAATEDGGAIVLMGNQLLKYDKDLNLVKKVEINIDWESWNKTMMQHRRMMMGGQSE